jgi:hypothetical protein
MKFRLISVQGLKPLLSKDFIGTAEQLAEVVQFSSNKHKTHTSGAKARHFLSSIYGTTEVVP